MGYVRNRPNTAGHLKILGPRCRPPGSGGSRVPSTYAHADMVEETTGVVGKAIALKQSRQAEAGGEVMSLGDHLDELRTRLIYALLGLAPIFIAGLFFSKTILGFLITPMKKALQNEQLPAKFLATELFEVFSSWVLIAFLVTVIVGFPWVLYQAWRFVSPGLYIHERRFVYILMPLSVALSILGVLFMYVVALPAMLHFFVHFSTTIQDFATEIKIVEHAAPLPNVPVVEGDPSSVKIGDMWVNTPLQSFRICIGMAGEVPQILGVPLERPSAIQQTPKVREYLGQIITFGIMFALAFQAPVVVLLGGWVGFFTIPSLKKSRRIAIFIIAAISAVVTPPDPLSMMLLAVPLYILYEFGVFLLWIFPSPRALGKNAEETEGGEGPGAEA